MSETNASLNAQNRASGRLARGELYLRRMELNRARYDYEAAYEIDTAPLSKLNMAQIYMFSGRLEEARLYAEDCLKAGDLSWMLNYGIDPVRYKRDIHEILYKIYKGLAETEQFKQYGRPGEKTRSLFRKISYRFKFTVNHYLYQKYSMAAGDAYGKEIYDGSDPHLDSFIQYYNAFEKYPRRAINYMNRARNFESAIIPQSLPSYNLEEGVLFKNENLVIAALEGFDPVWELELISRSYTELARYGKGDIKAQAAEQLFAINKGALRQEGISLPLEIHIQTAGGNNKAADFISAAPTRVEKKIQRLLKKSGFSAVPEGQYSLTITVTASAGDSALTCELINKEQGSSVMRKTIPVKSLHTADLCDFVRTLGDAVFRE
jgi:hypothetical protein